MLYACLLAYVALIYIRPAEVIPGWGDVPLVAILTVVTTLVAGVSVWNRRQKLLEMPQDSALLGLWVAVGLSNLAWGWAGGAYGAVVAFAPAVFCYFVTRLAVRSHALLNRLVTFVILLTVFQGINGIVQYHYGVGFGSVAVLEQVWAPSGQDSLDDPVIHRRIRGTGIFSDPNDLALSFLLVIPLLLVRLVSRVRPLPTRVLDAIGLVAILVALIYTGSRGGIVGLAVALLGVLYLRVSAKAALVGCVGIVLTVGTVGGGSRLAGMSSSEEAAQSRVQAWGAGLEMFKSHPVFGVGYGRFTDYHDHVAHNAVVHALAELGVVGAALFLAVVYYVIRTQRNAWWAAGILGSREVQLRDGLMVSTVAFLTGMMFLSRQYNTVTYLLFGMGSVQAALSTTRSERLGAMYPRSWLHIALLTLAAVVITYVGVRMMARWSGS